MSTHQSPRDQRNLGWMPNSSGPQSLLASIHPDRVSPRTRVVQSSHRDYQLPPRSQAHTITIPLPVREQTILQATNPSLRPPVNDRRSD